MMSPRPVVLLHPIGSDGSFFNPLLAHLDGATTLAPDLPGHGRAASISSTSTLADYAEDVIRQVDRAGHEVIDVVGVSLGALVAATLAADFPDRVGKIVLADCVPRYPTAMVTMWTERAESVVRSGIGDFVEPTMSLWFTKGFLDEHPDSAYIRRVLESTDPHGYADACRVLASADVRAKVATLPQPTLMVCGTDDAQPFKDGADWLWRTIPDARIAWIDGGRHACFFENADDVSQVLTGFLSA